MGAGGQSPWRGGLCCGCPGLHPARPWAPTADTPGGGPVLYQKYPPQLTYGNLGSHPSSSSEWMPEEMVFGPQRWEERRRKGGQAAS